jgi:branched-chain amino acid transport system substrate-binding protein
MSRHTLGKFLVVCLVVSMIMAVFGCGKDKEEKAAKPAPAAAAGKVYKIGAVFAVTGGASPLGVPEKNTAEMLMEQINKNTAGGINGAKLEITILDTATDPTTARTRIEKLIADGVAAIVGPSTSGASLAIYELTQNAQIPLISCAASVKIVTPVEERKWVFKTPQSDSLIVGVMADHLKSQNISKVAIITVSDGYGRSGKAELERILPEAGIEIIQAEEMGPGDTDAMVQLTKIRDAKPGAVICWSIQGAGAVVTKNFRADLKVVDIPLIMSHGVANKQYIELSGEAANGVILPAGKLLVAGELPDSDPQKAVLTKYIADYKAEFGDEPNTFGGHAWDAIQLVAKAMEKVGDDKAKIRDEIEKTTNFVGTGGIFNFSATEHNGLTKQGVVMVKVMDGKWTLLK